jgi:ectoine hydroxylase-related dioxygenase (phytanoyl-CoA dioxygenase family)
MKGSHKCGRIEHVSAFAQQQADPERMQLLQKVHTHAILTHTHTHKRVQYMPIVDVNMRAGDCLFIHGNLLHCSGVNRSTSVDRWNMCFG